MKPVIIKVSPNQMVRRQCELKSFGQPDHEYFLKIADTQTEITLDLEGNLEAIFQQESTYWKLPYDMIHFYDDLGFFYDYFSIQVFSRIYNWDEQKTLPQYIRLKPEKPFQDWLVDRLEARQALPNSNAFLTLDSLESLSGIYCISQQNDPQILAYLDKNFEKILKQEFSHFEKEKKYWPALSKDTFDTFFSIQTTFAPIPLLAS